MSARSNRVKAKIKRILVKYGEPLTLTKPGTTAYDPDTLVNTPVGGSSVTIYGIANSTAIREFEKMINGDGVSIRITRQTGLFVDGMVEPVVGDIITYKSGIKMKINGATPVILDSDPVAFALSLE